MLINSVTKHRLNKLLKKCYPKQEINCFLDLRKYCSFEEQKQELIQTLSKWGDLFQ